MTKAQEMLEIADAYEAGLQKMIACGYEEYGPEPQRKHRLIIDALRLAAQADAPAILPQCAKEPHVHSLINGLDGSWRCENCGERVEVAIALTRPKLCPTEKTDGSQS